MDLIGQAKTWRDQDPDATTCAELTQLIETNNLAELASRFDSKLEFGTAGLRGELGAGPNRMNRVVVARAALAIARFLQRNRAEYLDADGGLSVVIGYDGRVNSDVFATDSAQIIAGAGISAKLFDRGVPTPVAAFTGATTKASATIVVTASHNPPRDNGYKVYLGGKLFGSQLIPPQDAEIAQLIDEVSQELSFDQIPKGDQIEMLGDAAVNAYVERAKGLVPATNALRAKVKITHTALHGVGWPVVSQLFSQLGFELLPVTQQQEADGSFPTVSFPNPEEAGAMDLAYETAKSAGSDLILANDPDADRLAVAIRSGGEYKMLTGDQVGLILAHEIASAADGGALGNSIVSAELTAVADRFGLDYQQTLTGFKWISKVPNLIFGYEEALGYCVDPSHTPDKDGITAALLIAELAANLAGSGSSLGEHLAQLEQSYGKISSGQVSVRVSDLSIIGKIMAAVRKNPPAYFEAEPLQYTDLSQSKELKTDAVILQSKSAKLIFRPSGTEPKLKCYLQFRGDEADLAKLKAFAQELISSYQ